MSGDLIQHVQSLRVPPQGIEYVKQAMARPSRLVSNMRTLNVTTRFASFKMGEVIQSESHTCELPFLCQLELNDDVLGVYDQPPKLPVEFLDIRERRHRKNKTFDFLVIRRTKVQIVECKTATDLEKLAGEKPNVWHCENGSYRYLPGEKPANALGFEAIVHNSADIGPVLAANLKLLVITKRSQVQPLDPGKLEKAKRLLTKRCGRSIQDLADAIRLNDVSAIMASILVGDLFALPSWHHLALIDATPVYASQSDADHAGALLAAAADASPFAMRNYQAPIALSRAAEAHTRSALDLLQRFRAGEVPANRKIYRILARLRAAGDGKSLITTLAPRFFLRGAKPSLGKEIEDLITEAIDAHYSDPRHLSITASHCNLLLELKKRNLSPVCYETFRQRVKSRPKEKLALARSGIRSSHAAMPPMVVEESAIEASFAWERAHIDSTVLDEMVWLQCELSSVLARPTIYILVDEYSSKILAYWCCFANAGRQAVACLLRDCIRRHGKLPCSIMHDLGAEYLSVYNETFNATFVIDLQRRPSRAPRWGAHVESGIKRITKLIAHRLYGNTQNDKLGRAGDSGYRGAAHARHNLVTLMEILDRSIIKWLNGRPIGDEPATPDAIFKASDERFGSLARPAPLSAEILAHTAIPDGTRLISYERGIVFKHHRFYGPGIADPSLDQTKVQVRWEPYNPRILYAHVGGKWERLTARGYAATEHAGHMYQLAQLYYWHDTAWSTRKARVDADMALASQQHEALLLEDQKPVQELPQTDVSQLDAFALARSLDSNQLGKEGHHVN